MKGRERERERKEWGERLRAENQNTRLFNCPIRYKFYMRNRLSVHSLYRLEKLITEKGQLECTFEIRLKPAPSGSNVPAVSFLIFL